MGLHITYGIIPPTKCKLSCAGHKKYPRIYDYYIQGQLIKAVTQVKYLSVTIDHLTNMLKDLLIRQTLAVQAFLQ